MTKLDLLRAFLTERLMVAAQEILEVVGDTVSEYQEETARTKRENERLQWRLREVGLEAEIIWHSGTQPAARPVSGGKSLIEQQLGEQEWSSSLRQDTKLSLTEEKQDVTEERRIRQREEEPVCSRTTESSDHFECCTLELNTQVTERRRSILTASCVKSELGHNLVNSSPSHLLKIQINKEEVDSLPNMVSSQIKTEPNGVDYHVTEKFTSEFFGELNSDSENNANGSGAEGWSAAQSEAQEAEETQEAVEGQRSHSCPECGKSFIHAYDLKLHVQIHIEKPYCCTECGKCFNHAGHFKVHQRIHTGEKPYSCPQCRKRFNQIGHLNAHLRIHTGEKPYICNVCGRRFIGSHTLKVHCRIHTGERPYCCIPCGKAYNRRTHLNDHLRTTSHLKNVQNL